MTEVTSRYYCATAHATPAQTSEVGASDAQWRGLATLHRGFLHCPGVCVPGYCCLAHTNRCLNPVLYCLTRSEFGATLRGCCAGGPSPLRSDLPISLPPS
ncbi:hypothetical protein FKM82_008830 [Ascaphus truei]